MGFGRVIMPQSYRAVSLVLLGGVLLSGCNHKPAEKSTAKFEGTIPTSGAATVSLHLELV